MRVERCAGTKTLPVEVTQKKVFTCYLINVAHKLHTHTHPRFVLPVFAPPWPFIYHYIPNKAWNSLGCIPNPSQAIQILVIGPSCDPSDSPVLVIASITGPSSPCISSLSPSFL
jgi:hypothetical protein